MKQNDSRLHRKTLKQDQPASAAFPSAPAREQWDTEISVLVVSDHGRCSLQRSNLQSESLQASQYSEQS